MIQLHWMDAVTDRTAEDVERVCQLHAKGWKTLTEEEQVEWLHGMKGALNYQDLARIENNIQVLSDSLELNLSIGDNTVPEIPDTVYFTKVLFNVEIIRGAYCIHDDTPPVPQMPLNDFRKINDVEKILFDVYDILNHNFNYLCGEGLYAGEETGMLI